MNEYFTEMTQIILDEHGTINQYAGDLIMASFGAPIPTEDHSQRAVAAAVKMHRRIQEMKAEINPKDLPPLGCRTGINTGKMFFGNLGSQQVFYYSVMGDSVNTAARLETANKFYDTRLIISESTFENLQPDFFRVRILDVVKVKGKSKSVKIFEVYGDTSHPITTEELNYYEAYQRAYMAYLAKEFSTARKEFILARSHRPDDKASIGMIQRIDNLDSTRLSQDWDGSVDLKAK
jgi:adenylate cyclase